ncbi:bacterio-opsin activator domain-containing protein [Haladaptatus salinisoli]|uniref:bacterio-opsin activator domain-containing protein n=1 Tax=Haladaptatus salinisoli TaxID=2884876 RepID=UPI001D0B6751|nr:bacterio-opsin activator domain-containing protein [Haladaptatus salinisoli]
MGGEENDGFLTTAEYERLRRGTETYREDIVVALAGRVGLRPSELTRVRPADLRPHERGDERFYLLAIPEGDGETRDAYVPADVAHDLRKFAAANDVGRDDPFIAVSPRRVQMLVGDVADRVDGLGDVTCRDLRKHFAWRHLVEEGIDPRAVQAVGGWKSLDSLAPYLDAPTAAEIVDAFASRTRGRGRGRGGRAARDSRSAELLACAEALGRAFEEASTNEDVERAACEQLADVYRAVWICDESGAPRASAAPERTDDVPSTVLRETDAVAEGETADVTILAGPSDGPLSRCSFAVAPLRSSETVHGLLCVAADSFRSADRTLLADVGRRVGRTATSIARKRLLLADTGVVLSLRSTDSDEFLVSASAELGCRFALQGVVPVEDRSLLYFVTARGAAVGDVLDRVTAADAVEDARLVRDYGDDALFEFVVSGESLATVLAERGGTVRELSVEAGVLEVSGVFSQRVDVRRVVEAVEAAFPETNLLSKGEIEEPARSAVSVRQTVRDELTERQQTVLRAAYLAGYFEWPRGSTAEELAASMGVSSPTLHNHLRKAQQKVFDTVFEEVDRRSSDVSRH